MTELKNLPDLPWDQLVGFAKAVMANSGASGNIEPSFAQEVCKTLHKIANKFADRKLVHNSVPATINRVAKNDGQKKEENKMKRIEYDYNKEMGNDYGVNFFHFFGEKQDNSDKTEEYCKDKKFPLLQWEENGDEYCLYLQRLHFGDEILGWLFCWTEDGEMMYYKGEKVRIKFEDGRASSIFRLGNLRRRAYKLFFGVFENLGVDGEDIHLESEEGDYKLFGYDLYFYDPEKGIEKLIEVWGKGKCGPRIGDWVCIAKKAY